MLGKLEASLFHKRFGDVRRSRKPKSQMLQNHEILHIDTTGQSLPPIVHPPHKQSSRANQIQIPTQIFALELKYLTNTLKYAGFLNDELN